MVADDDDLTLKPGISVEGLHPNVFGYDIMYNILCETLTHHNIQI